jgi:hypothetical protein
MTQGKPWPKLPLLVTLVQAECRVLLPAEVQGASGLGWVQHLLVGCLLLLESVCSASLMVQLLDQRHRLYGSLVARLGWAGLARAAS